MASSNCQDECKKFWWGAPSSKLRTQSGSCNENTVRQRVYIVDNMIDPTDRSLVDIFSRTRSTRERIAKNVYNSALLTDEMVEAVGLKITPGLKVEVWKQIYEILIQYRRPLMVMMDAPHSGELGKLKTEVKKFAKEYPRIPRLSQCFAVCSSTGFGMEAAVKALDYAASVHNVQKRFSICVNLLEVDTHEPTTSATGNLCKFDVVCLKGELSRGFHKCVILKMKDICREVDYIKEGECGHVYVAAGEGIDVFNHSNGYQITNRSTDDSSIPCRYLGVTFQRDIPSWIRVDSIVKLYYGSGYFAYTKVAAHMLTETMAILSCEHDGNVVSLNKCFARLEDFVFVAELDFDSSLTILKETPFVSATITKIF
ncbi:hypothetical protein V1512DRAFT_293230 [Lipomyces arxii]|uniref:uncharacterized protein n=1 Tax=Lipomyces arxii TaxID=56418 RepID=UPI0034CFE9EB